MSTLHYDAKQATAMADFAIDRAKARLDDAIDAEESRDELVAARTQELITQRMAAMAPIDIVAGMQSIMEVAANQLRPHLLAGRIDYVGAMVKALIDLYIEQDSEVVAEEWMERVEREAAQWGN
ncbi:hypothetical protein [Paraburkholderia atlantica]|uniref:hypothetical protein n=1 Tax=Paraburkholderia atlantica TaxID=2654982 RepID=UPI001616D499|nr:hypothetical protein [Paraburkholderia atlantica]MBB5509593.1 hypothetical protein [Paraburkholderia atlantica]